MKRFSVFHYGLLLLTSLHPVESHAQSSENEDALLWEITGNGIKGSSFLFGTIHMICPDDFVIGRELSGSFGKADKVYMEVDMDDPDLPLKTLELSQLKTRKLSDLFSPDDYTKLNQFFKDSIGMPLTLLNTMKPLVLLSLLTMKTLACTTPQSYEQTFVRMAKDQKKEVSGLETIEEQVQIFDDIPDSIQVKMVMGYVNGFNEQKKEFNGLVNLYKQEKLDSLYNMIVSAPDMAGAEETLLFKRNEKWLPIIENTMKELSGFFAVGAGHLGGPRGLINLFRLKGYSVKPLKELP